MMNSNTFSGYETSEEKEVILADAIDDKRQNSKPRRVGTVSVGLSMVMFGVLFLLCSVFGILSYETVFAFWPVILILLGVEVMVFSFMKGKLIYDKGSVLIMILMLFLSAGMAAVDVCWKAAEYYMPYL